MFIKRYSHELSRHDIHYQNSMGKRVSIIGKSPRGANKNGEVFLQRRGSGAKESS